MPSLPPPGPAATTVEQNWLSKIWRLQWVSHSPLLLPPQTNNTGHCWWLSKLDFCHNTTLCTLKVFDLAFISCEEEIKKSISLSLSVIRARSPPDMFSFLTSDLRPERPELDPVALEMAILSAENSGSSKWGTMNCVIGHAYVSISLCARVLMAS